MSRRTTLTGGISLQDQWNRLVKNPTIAKNFTNSLYDAMYFRSGFIAHHNKDGFYRNRFSTLAALDYTLELMLETPELKELVDNTNPKSLAHMRYLVASHEAYIITLEISIRQKHLEALQKQFNWELI